MLNSSVLIINPFNTVFWLVTLFFLTLLLIASLLMAKKNEKQKKTFFITVCLFTIIAYFLYKYELSLDSEFDLLRDFIGGFNWWGELPLQLCNINMLLIPIAVLFDIRPLKSFSFFAGTLGAAMALLMPGTGFENAPLFLPRILGYYGTHYMIVIEALGMVSFGFYRPKYGDMLKTLLTLMIIGFIIHLINLAMRSSGLYDRANYFFTMETENNFILEFLYQRIPCPYLYLLPLSPVFYLYMFLVTSCFEVPDKKRNGSL